MSDLRMPSIPQKPGTISPPPRPLSGAVPPPPPRPIPGAMTPPKPAPLARKKEEVSEEVVASPVDVVLPGRTKNEDAPTLPKIKSNSTEESKSAIEKLKDLKNTVKDMQTANKAQEESEDAMSEIEDVDSTEAEEATETEEAEDTIEATETEEVIEEDSKKQEVKETTKPRKRNTRKKEEHKEEQMDDDEDIIIRLKPTCKDFQAMEDAICNSTFNDPEWEKEKQSIVAENAKIIIDEDMNPSTLKVKVAQLCALRDRIYLDYCKYQTNYQNLESDKPEGIVERTKRLYSKGSNDFERRRNGIIGCMQYTYGDQNINLFELLEQTRERYYFYKSIMNNIEWKSKTIITMNSAIIMEQKLEK